MVKKHTILTLGLVLSSGLAFDAAAITPKGVALAATGAGIATNWVVGKQLGLDSKSALGAGVLAGIATGSALVRRDCRLYKELVGEARRELGRVKGYELLSGRALVRNLEKSGYDKLLVQQKFNNMYPVQTITPYIAHLYNRLYSRQPIPAFVANLDLISLESVVDYSVRNLATASDLINCERSLLDTIEGAWYAAKGYPACPSEAEELLWEGQILLKDIQLHKDIAQEQVSQWVRANKLK